MSETFQAGDMTIHRIVEEQSGLAPALELLPGLTPERLAENRDWLRRAGALTADDVTILCFQSYVVKTPHHTILIDSCIGNHKPRPTRPSWHLKDNDIYLGKLASFGLAVSDIDVVMCTHLHADHVGWNTRLENGRWVPTFPNARYIFGATEYEHWTQQHGNNPIAAFDDSVLPVVQAGRADMVQNDFTIGDHVRLLPTPGHTPGHVSIALGRGADKAVMTGDALHSPLQARYPELSAKFDGDMAGAAKSRRGLLERLCETDTLCCTAHFPSPSVGRIKRWGEGFRCDPV